MRIPKKLFNAAREIPLYDKEDEFKRERLFQRVYKIPISKTPNEIARMDFVDYGDGGRLLPTYEILFRAIRRLRLAILERHRGKPLI